MCKILALHTFTWECIMIEIFWTHSYMHLSFHICLVQLCQQYTVLVGCLHLFISPDFQPPHIYLQIAISCALLSITSPVFTVNIHKLQA